MSAEGVLPTHLQELRRGTVVVASLIALEQPGYGYGLLQTLAEAGFSVDGNTLYPLLRRLEDQGLLTSEWDTSASKPRKFYRTSDLGREVRAALLEDLAALARRVHRPAESEHVMTSLTDRYIYSTTRELPAARRAEIGHELHASITDRSTSGSRPVNRRSRRSTP